MKKIFIAAIAVLGFTTANAQYKAEKGDFQTSIDFRPFKSDGNVFSTVGIKGNYFVSDKDAIRLGINFGLNNEKEGEASKESTKTTDRTTEFSFNVGYERHFGATERLDLYAGIAAGWGMCATKQTSETVNADNSASKTELKNGKITDWATEGENVYAVAGEATGYGQFNVGIFTGANFYVYKKLFVGAEISFDFNNKKYKDIQATYANKSYTFKPNQSETSLKFNVTPALKIGWTF